MSIIQTFNYNTRTISGAELSEPMILVANASIYSTVSLPLISDTIDVTVDWGDGTVESYNTSGYRSHVYSTGGEKTITISGTLDKFGDPDQTVFRPLRSLVRVESFGSGMGLTSLDTAFADCTNLVSVPAQLPSSVNNLSWMFLDCDGASQSSFGGEIYWDTTNVSNIRGMFAGASYNANLSNWNTSNVVDMSYLFNFNYDFNDDGIITWDTSNVANLEATFRTGGVFNVNVGSWNTSNVTSMSSTFEYCYYFNQPLTNWDTSKVEDMYSMFVFNEVFNQPLDHFDVSKVKYVHLMFQDTYQFNQNLSSWSLDSIDPNGYGLYYVFYSATQYNNGDVPLTWNTSNVTLMDGTFRNAQSFNVDVSAMNTSNVSSMYEMFRFADSFNQPLNSWDVSKVVNFSGSFDSAISFNQPLNSWNTGNVTLFTEMFQQANNFNGDISNWDTSNVVSMLRMFEGANSFNQPINSWNVTSVASNNMYQMFKNANSFNQSLNSWDVSKIVHFGEMFDGARAFNGDISGWNTSNVANMSRMFANTNSFNVDIGSWNTSNVKLMIGTFDKANAFSRNLNSWNTSNVVSMQEMFEYNSIFNENITSWNTSNVTNMLYMFNNATAFDQDLSGWCVTKIPSLPTSFYTNATSWNIAGRVPRWGTCGEINLITNDGSNSNSYFGWASAISNTGQDIVVGAYGLNSVSSGEAYVFTKSGSDWILQQKLLQSDPESEDFFGSSVSISGDTCIVGASREDGVSFANSGAAYIFTRSAGVWTEQQKLTAIDANDEELFGYSVDIDGDTCIVGAISNDSSGFTGSGAAYIFTRSAGVWSLEQQIIAGDPGVTDRFGVSVAIDGDTCIVGAYLEDGAGSDRGAAYVFTRSAGVWTQQQKLTASDTQNSDQFGISVDIDGDTCIVGAYLEDGSGTDRGAAYIFTRSAGVWTQQRKIAAASVSASNNGQLGWDVAISGNTAVIGARHYQSPSVFSGAAYVYKRTGSTWSIGATIQPSDTAANDRFGTSVDIYSNTTVVVGAASKTVDGNVNVGAAYVYNIG